MPDPPDHLNLRIGESRRVEFRGLPSAGYSWQYEIVGDDGVIGVDWSSATRSVVTVSQAGAGTVETLTVTGEEPGTVQLRVRWRRRWDPPDVAKKEHLVAVTVSAR